MLVFDPITPLQTTSDDLEGLLVMIGGFLLGLLFIYAGASLYNTARLIKNTPTEKARSVAIGRTELKGRCRDTGTTFDQPFSDGQCVYRKWEVEEYVDTDDGHEWRTQSRGTDVADFYVEDDTGQILIDADQSAQFEISDENREKIKVDDHDSLPSRVEAFYQNDDGGAANGTPEESAGAQTKTSEEGGAGLVGNITDTVSSMVEDSQRPDPDNKRRFKHEVLPVDSDVYVFGAAYERDDAQGANADRLVIRRDEDTNRFVISDRDESNLVKRYTILAPILMLLGLLTSGGMLYLLLDSWLV